MSCATGHLIAPAGPADADALARVHVQAWRETYNGILPPAYLQGLSIPLQARRWRRRLLMDNEFTLIADDGQGVAGYCSGDWARPPTADGEGEISTLYVLRRAQGQGVGRALLTGAARVLAARGATSLVIWVLRDNAPARSFYEHLGGCGEVTGGEWVGGGLVASVGYRWPDLKGWLESPLP